MPHLADKIMDAHVKGGATTKNHSRDNTGLPVAVPQFRLRTAVINSSMLRESSKPCLGSAAGKSSMTCGLKMLGISSTLLKWVCQQDFSPSGLVTRSPFASRSADAVAGLCPLRLCSTERRYSQLSRRNQSSDTDHFAASSPSDRIVFERK